MIFAFFRKPLGWLVGALIFAAVMWAAFAFITSGQRAKIEAKLGRNTTEAAINSGRDAVDTLGKQQSQEAATDATTRANEAEIRNAPGADAPVAPAASQAGIRAICKRQSARGDPKCQNR